MPTPFFHNDQLIAELAAGSLVLTPNHRLSRHILSAWSDHHQQRGTQVWRQAHIYSLDIWLRNTWDLLQDNLYPVCLTKTIASMETERLIWQWVIDEDPQKPVLVAGSAFAELAQDALQKMQRWLAPLSSLANNGHDPGQHFYRWQKAFGARMKGRELITAVDAELVVLEAYREKFLPLQKRVILIGFQTDLPPLYQKILDEAFTEVTFWRETSQSPQKQLCVVASDDDEITCAAHWAKKQLDKNADQRIGIVFPSLANKRHKIERIFRQAFTPEHSRPDMPRDLTPFNMSGGLRLGETPLVNSALNLLNLRHSPQPLEYYYQLLNDPFWGDVSNEENCRARCQVLLREGGQLSPATAQFRHCMKVAEDGLPKLERPPSKLLQQIEDKIRHQPAFATFNFWAAEFSKNLALLNWPGSRSLDSIEFQQQQRWFEALNDLRKLSSATDRVDANSALARLTKICGDHIIQPEGKHSPVQVLGLLEASGLQFDKLWLAETHDLQWPQTPSYNALLPVHLQRQYKMPRSSSAGELLVARRMLRDFENNCHQLILSFAIGEQDEQHQLSRLVESDLPELDILSLLPDPSQTTDTGVPLMERIIADQAPPLMPNQDIFLGGSTMLRDQALCPFNAFAIWRLGAKPLTEPQFGLTAQERGKLVHGALELFWARCETSSNLLTMSANDCNNLLTNCISSVLFNKNNNFRFGRSRYLNLEAQRLNRLISSWLDMERKRPPFAVVAREKEVVLQLGQLPLALRIDRIDQLDDGSVIVIDYKTGKVSLKSFAQTRPEEPQLLLYGLALNQPLTALCFGRLSATNEIALVGITDKRQHIGGLVALEDIELPDNWEETLALWKTRLESLASDFCRGSAEMTVYSRSVADYQSYLFPLNRWHEIYPTSETQVDLSFYPQLSDAGEL